MLTFVLIPAGLVEAEVFLCSLHPLHPTYRATADRSPVPIAGWNHTGSQAGEFLGRFFGLQHEVQGKPCRTR